MRVYSLLLFFVCMSSIHGAETLLSLRGDHQTELRKKEREKEPLPEPPPEVFSVVQFDTDLGKMKAYLSTHELKAGEKRPAMIWLTGGFPVASPGEYLWEETQASNEQSARVFRNEGVVMMFPTLRGRAGNPGVVERYYGEVQDVIRAAAYLKGLEYVDPKRIYLGGHSSGATLALLVAAATDQFAGVISLGPVSDHYGPELAPYVWNEKEIELRSPINYLQLIRTPTYILEGDVGNNNIDELRLLFNQLKEKPNPNVHIAPVKGADHFNLIHPVNSIFADKIIESKDGRLDISVKAELIPSYQRYAKRMQESEDLYILSEIRAAGTKIEGKHRVFTEYYAEQKHEFTALIEEAREQGFQISTAKKEQNSRGGSYYSIRLGKELRLDSLSAVFALSWRFRSLAEKHALEYSYWQLLTPPEKK